MKTRSFVEMTICVLAVAASVVSYRVGRARADGVPAVQPMYYSGTIEDGGAPVADGTRNISLVVWDTGSGGAALCTTTAMSTPVIGGRFRIPLVDACTAAVRANPDLWMEVLVDGGSFGRTKLGAVPYAIEAGRAAGASGTLATRLTALEARTGARQLVIGPVAPFPNIMSPAVFAPIPMGPTASLTAAVTGRYRASTVILANAGGIEYRITATVGTPTFVWQPQPAANGATVEVTAYVALTAGVSYSFAVEHRGPGACCITSSPVGGTAIVVEQLE